MSLNCNINYFNYDNILYTKKFFEYESYFIEKFFRYFNSSINFNNDYENLIKKLDKNSIKVIDRIIERVNIVSKLNSFSSYDLFSKEEKKMIYKNYKTNRIYYGLNNSKYNDIIFPKGYEFELWNCIYKSGLLFFKNKNLKNKDIIDIGAFIGDSALFFKQYTKGNIYCIEPDIDNFYKMKNVLFMNNAKDIKCFNIAIADKEGKLKFKSRGIMSSIIYENNNENSEVYEVNANTLDNFVIENKVKPSVIKIDTEGAEKFVLKGAYNTLKTFKPIILISIYHNPEDFLFIKKQIEEMDLKYKFRIVKPDDGLILRKTTLLAA